MRHGHSLACVAQEGHLPGSGRLSNTVHGLGAQIATTTTCFLAGMRLTIPAIAHRRPVAEVVGLADPVAAELTLLAIMGRIEFVVVAFTARKAVAWIACAPAAAGRPPETIIPTVVAPHPDRNNSTTFGTCRQQLARDTIIMWQRQPSILLSRTTARRSPRTARSAVLTAVGNIDLVLRAMLTLATRPCSHPDPAGCSQRLKPSNATIAIDWASEFWVGLRSWTSILRTLAIRS